MAPPIFRNCILTNCTERSDGLEHPACPNRQFFCGWPHYLAYIRGLEDDDPSTDERWYA